LYKDSLAAKKTADAAPKAPEAKPDEAVDAEDDDDDLNEPINEDEDVAPPDIEGLENNI
jgi:hypothetical protein